MEQLIYYRDNQAASGAVPNLKSHIFKAFQAYILPASGPVFIKAEVEAEIVSAAPKKPVNKKKAKAPKKKSGAKKPLSYKGPLQKRGEPETSSPPPASAKTPGEAELAPMKVEPAIPPSSRVITAPPPKAELPAMVHEPFVPRMINIRDVQLRMEHRNSTNYRFQEKVYKFPFSGNSPHCFSPAFLSEIKALTHLSPKTDKLPNIAQGAITFHYQLGKSNRSKTFKLEELFLSGGKFFGRDGFPFRDQHKIVNAMQDMLTQEEKTTIQKLEMGKKGVPLGIAMEKHLRRQVIEGPWKNNCVDSESVLILRLVRKLPNLLRYSLFEGSTQPIKLKHAALSISSYRDCCPNCQKLIQGFQWRLRDLILGLNIPNLHVDEHFGTLAIVKGHVPLEGKYPQEAHKVFEGPIDLRDSIHTLVCANSTDSK